MTCAIEGSLLPSESSVTIQSSSGVKARSPLDVWMSPDAPLSDPSEPRFVEIWTDAVTVSVPGFVRISRNRA